MKKTVLFFIMFLGSLTVHGQTDYGILIKSTIKPRNTSASSTRYTICGVSDYSLTGSTGSIDLYIKRFCTNNITPVNGTEKIQYDFFYSKDIDGIFILDAEINGQNQSNCAKEYAIPYNKNTFTEVVLGGCVGRSNVWSIYLKQPDNNTACIEETINLSNGWNWEYKYDTGDWQSFPPQFQDKRSITFKLKDLEGYDKKSKVFFQTGYKKQFTNVINYTIIPCSPELDGPPITFKVECNNESNGSVIFKLKDNIATSQKLLVTLYEGTTFRSHRFINHADIDNKTFIWNGLAPGQYNIKYQAQNNLDNNTIIGANPIISPSFTIENVLPLTFTATAIQPKCSTDKGGILITATGGTPPYYYILGNEAKKELITNPYTIPIASDGNHNVKIIDSKNCIEK